MRSDRAIPPSGQTDGVDAYVDTVQVRGSARPRPSRARGHTLEIATVLCVALIAATGWAVLAADWVQGGGGAIVVATLSVIEAALLAQAHAPRIATALAAPFLALAAIVPTTLAAMPRLPGQTTGAVAGHYIRALFTGLSSTHDWDFTVGLSAILFICGYWLGWMALREHRGVLAVVPIFSVLATNVVNAAKPGPVALPETVAVGLAIAVVAVAHLGSLDKRWAASQITAFDGLRWRFGTSAAGVAVILTLVAVLLPPVSTTDISAKLFPTGLGIGAGQRGKSPGGASGAASIGFSQAVVPGGPLVSVPRTVFTYTDDTLAPVDFAVANDTVFDKGNWYGPARGAPGPGGTTWAGIDFTPGPLPRDNSISDGGAGAHETAVHADILLDPGATGSEALAPFAGEPEAINDQGTAFGTAVGAVSDASPLLTVDSVQLTLGIQVGTKITSTGFVSTATEAQLRTAGTNYPAWTSQFTELSDDSTHGVEAIRSLAKAWTAGASNQYDKAIAIEQRLRSAPFQYTLNPHQLAGASLWPVVYFLTVTHRGYCQYFASAMGSMLRSLGIPTRLVSGFGPGATEDVNGPQAVNQVQTQSVTTTDAHTWVEAYFPGYGWIPFEPTPPSSQGNYQPFARGLAAVSAVRVPAGPVTTPATTPATPHGFRGQDPNVSPAGSGSAGMPVAVVTSLAVLGGVALLLVAAVLWLLLPRSLAGAWKRVETLGVISGVARHYAETHRAYAARLAGVRPGAGTALLELAAVTARAEFSASGASPRDRAQALRTWRRALFGSTQRRKR